MTQILSKKKKKESFLDLIGDNSKLSIKLDTSLNVSSFKFSFNHIYNDITCSPTLSKEHSLLLQHELCRECARGNVKLLHDDFAQNLSKKYNISDQLILGILNEASEHNIIFLQNRQFTHTKSLRFVSLKVPLYFAHENFVWTIYSLIQDQVYSPDFAEPGEHKKSDSERL